MNSNRLYRISLYVPISSAADSSKIRLLHQQHGFVAKLTSMLFYWKESVSVRLCFNIVEYGLSMHGWVTMHFCNSVDTKTLMNWQNWVRSPIQYSVNLIHFGQLPRIAVSDKDLEVRQFLIWLKFCLHALLWLFLTSFPLLNFLNFSFLGLLYFPNLMEIQMTMALRLTLKVQTYIYVYIYMFKHI